MFGYNLPQSELRRSNAGCRQKVTDLCPLIAMNIAVIGTGYVGLVTATCFAETGNHVVGVDINAEKVASLKAGHVPIFEPGLEPLFARSLRQGRLRFTTELEEGTEGAELVFLELPTPPQEDGSADLSYVLGVARQLGPMITQGRHLTVVNKSTVPVGTGALVAEALAEGAVGTFDVVSNPEFLREGVAVEDFMKPDRVVIGASSEAAAEVMRKLYAPYVRGGAPILVMDVPSAELTKYAANAFLATKITFMNEVAAICERVGADVDMVRRGIGTDARIGKKFLFAGTGYGGSCFPKDVRALATTAREAGTPFRIIEAVLDVNDAQRTILVDKMLARYGSLEGKTFAVWGLAFKPNTDDTREAPALYTIQRLQSLGAKVRAFDPEAMPAVAALLGAHFSSKEGSITPDRPDKIENGSRLTLCDNEYDTLQGADALAILTEWAPFRVPDFERMKQLLINPHIFDGRNLYEPAAMEGQGFVYESIGRRVVEG